MNLSTGRTGKQMTAAWGLAFLLLLVSLFGAGGGGGNFRNFNAAVTIKTQSAANQLVKDGGIRGIDVSKWQGSIDWSKVAQDDVSFAFIRASYGASADAYFVNNAKNAHANGIKVGAYHYARFTNSTTMKQEANYFISQLKKVDITYPVALDVEAHHGLSKTNLTNLCKEFMDIVKAAGYDVMFYSYQNFIDAYINKSTLSDYSFWVANYIQKPGNIGFSVWQHTSYGSVKGISGRVDINIATKDLSTKRTVYVNRETSDYLKTYLTQTYGVPITMDDKINMSEVGLAMREGFQQEIVSQFGYTTLVVDGNPGETEADILSSISFTSETQGRITTLLQCRLFYRGNYTNEITGRFDAHTVEALKAFQRDMGITVTGTPNYETWMKIFKV